MSTSTTEGAREEQVLKAAETLVVGKRSLAISFNQIAAELDVSRSLLYVYFDSVPAIIDKLFLVHARDLEARIEPALQKRGPFRDRALEANLAYLNYVVDAGPLLQLVLRERRLDSPLSDKSRRLFRSFLRRIASACAAELQITPREAFVFLELTSAIPESLGRLVREKQIDIETGRSTCERLVGVSIDTIMPAA